MNRRRVLYTVNDKRLREERTIRQISYQINKGPFTPVVARVTGIVLSGICLAFFASVMVFPSA